MVIRKKRRRYFIVVTVQGILSWLHDIQVVPNRPISIMQLLKCAQRERQLSRSRKVIWQHCADRSATAESKCEVQEQCVNAMIDSNNVGLRFHFVNVLFAVVTLGTFRARISAFRQSVCAPGRLLRVRCVVLQRLSPKSVSACPSRTENKRTFPENLRRTLRTRQAERYEL